MYIIDFDEYLFEAKASGYAKLRSLGFTIRIRCCSKYESIKGIKKLRFEVYNTRRRQLRSGPMGAESLFVRMCVIIE